MTPIPAEAMPVVEVLRRDVPRPTDIPYLNLNCGCLRWLNGCCPMGLHPKGIVRTPVTGYAFANGLECNSGEVQAFVRWWDWLSNEDTQEAVDAIWPPVEGS